MIEWGQPKITPEGPSHFEWQWKQARILHPIKPGQHAIVRVVWQGSRWRLSRLMKNSEEEQASCSCTGGSRLSSGRMAENAPNILKLTHTLALDILAKEVLPIVPRGSCTAFIKRKAVSWDRSVGEGPRKPR